MVRRGRLRDLAVRPHLPKRTVRLRLTALYCVLFFPLGVALVVITFVVTILSSRPVVDAPLVRLLTDTARPSSISHPTELA